MPGLVLIGLLAASLALRLWLAWRQARYLRHVEDARLRRYATARAVFGIGVAACQAGLILALTLGRIIAWLERVWRPGPMAGAGIVGTVVLAFSLLAGVAHIGQSLTIDARSGLERRRLGACLCSALVAVAASVALAALAGQALSWLIATYPTVWWLWATVLAGLGLSAKANLGSRGPSHTSAQAGPADAPDLSAALARCELPNIPVRVRKSPTGARRANARIVGAGRALHVEVSDTLLALLTRTEVEAVLAHEAGHCRRHHFARDLAAQIGLVAGGFAVLALAMRSPAIAQGLGISGARSAGWLALAVTLAPLAWFFLRPVRAYQRRRFEYEADDFAARHADAGALMRAVAKLNAANATPPASDPLYVRVYNFHPDERDRFRRLRASIGAD